MRGSSVGESPERALLKIVRFGDDYKLFWLAAPLFTPEYSRPKNMTVDFGFAVVAER